MIINGFEIIIDISSDKITQKINNDKVDNKEIKVNDNKIWVILLRSLSHLKELRDPVLYN